MDDYLDITFHCNGRIVFYPTFQYIGGKKVVLSDVNSDRLSIVQLGVMMCKLDVFNYENFFYVRPGHTLANGFKMIMTDDDILEMVSKTKEVGIVDIYVEHNPNVEVFDPSVPLSSERQLCLEWNTFCPPEIGSVSDREFEDGGSTNSNHDSSSSTVSLNLNVETIDEVESSYESESELHTPQQSGDEWDGEAEFCADHDFDLTVFNVGMRFSSPKVLKDAIKEYALRRSYNVKLIKNDRVRITAVCAGDCKWRLHASVISNDNTIMIKTYYAEHTCIREYRNRNCNSTWVAKVYIDRFKSQPDWSLVEVDEAVMKDYQVNISRSQAYRGRMKALKKINRSISEQYRRLWDYAAELRRSNEGSTIKIQCDHLRDGHPPVFRRFYVCFTACREGFLDGCRPFIALDACHLKGPCQGQLMAAIGVDGNDCLYPIAWAVVEAETEDSWTWFLSLLQDDIGHFATKGYTFISDQQKGLVPILNDVFSNVHHRFCARQLYENFQKQFKGLALKSHFWKAARCATRKEFDNEMTEIEKLNVGAYQYLSEIDPKYWARYAFSTFSKCDFLLNNMFESFNALILQAIDKPVIELLETIRKLIMVRIPKKFVLYSSMEHEFGNRIRKKLERCKSHARNAIPGWIRDFKYKVEYGHSQFVVDLHGKNCSCRQWDLSGIPCGHAIQCIYHAKQRPEEYVHESYNKQTLQRIYSHFLQPVNGPNLWPTTNTKPMQPPDIRRPPRRPRKQRKKDEDGSQSSRIRCLSQTKFRCSRCKGVGHNARSCKDPMERRACKSSSFMGFNIPSTDTIKGSQEAFSSVPVGTQDSTVTSKQ